MTRSALRPSGSFILRSPLLSFDEFEAWSQGLTAPGALRDGGSLAKALAADCAVLRARLREAIALPELREALYVASPGLSQGLGAWLLDPDGKKGRGAEDSLVRYFVRMATRSTPFGLVSGCSVGRLGPTNELRLESRSAYQRRSRLDMEYLCSLAEALCRDVEVRRVLTFRPTSTLYQAGDRLRYAEPSLTGKLHTHRLVAVEPSDYLARTLERARSGATAGEVAQALVDDDASGELRLGEAEEFVGELIASRILVPDLVPAITGREPIDALVEQLAPHEVTRGVATALAAVRDQLLVLDRGGLGADPESYAHVARCLHELPAEPEPWKMVQVDLFKPAAATLGPAVVEEVERGIFILQRIGGYDGKDRLAGFRRDFLARYQEGQAVPLVEALDEENGVGFRSARGAGADASPLLEGLLLRQEATDQGATLGARGELLLRKLEQAMMEQALQVELTEDDLAPFAAEKRPPLPDALFAMVAVGAASPEAVDRGDFRVYLKGAAGPSGVRLLGRFCHLSDEIRRCVVDHLAEEEALQPDAVFAEIVHLPEPRMGNILLRPQLRRHEIPLGARGGADAEHRIPITDLFVSVTRHEVVMTSARLGRRVLPRLTAAHNVTDLSLGAYKFLWALQQDGVCEDLFWRWGALESLSFLPRVTAGRVVLARARWNVPAAEIAALVRLAGAERFRAVHEWRARRRIPRLALMVDGDKQLLVDFDNVLLVDAFLSMVRKYRVVQLDELFPGPGELCLAGPEGRFVHDVVIPFVRQRQVVARPAPRPAAGAARRSFPPGSEWTFAKLYTGTSTADRVLREAVAPLVAEAQASGAVDRWFFIRYGDPDWHLRLRLHGHPERLRTEVLPALCGIARALIDGKRLWRFQLDTYEREVERYGGEAGICLAERLFHVDSETVLRILERLGGDEGAVVRWQLALRGIALLLRDLGFEPAERLEVLERMQRASASEFSPGTELRMQLARRLRRDRRQLEQALAPSPRDDDALAAGARALEWRSRQLAPIVGDLRQEEWRGRLAVRIADLAPAYVHMFANRLLRSEARAQEMVFYDFLYRLSRSRAAAAGGALAAGR